MTTSNPVDRSVLPPNHHAALPGLRRRGRPPRRVDLHRRTCRRRRPRHQADRHRALATMSSTSAADPGVAVRRAAASAASVVGIDPAPVMLRVARRLTAPSPCVGSALPGGHRRSAAGPRRFGHRRVVAGDRAPLARPRRRARGGPPRARVRRVVSSPSSVAWNRGARPGQSRLDRRPGAHVCRTVPCRRLRRRRDRSPPEPPRTPRRLRPCSPPWSVESAAWR